MKRTCLVHAIPGGIIPYLFFAQFISVEGFNLILC
jgi:hypothetical protein